MDVTARRGAAEREDFIVARADLIHLLLADLRVVKRRTPVRRALKDRQVADSFSEFLDCLYGGRAGADDTDALPGEIGALLRPSMRVT